MNKQNCLAIGTIIKTHGIHGELVLEAKISDLFKNIEESVFLEIDGLLVPFFIEEIHPTSKERFRIKFDWIDSEPLAKKISNCPVYIPLKSITNSEIEFEENYDILIGFMVIDRKLGKIGTIDYTINSDDNPLMAISYKSREILIPIHPDLIKDVNTEEKTISIESPEGLIDLYLE